MNDIAGIITRLLLKEDMTPDKSCVSNIYHLNTPINVYIHAAANANPMLHPWKLE